MQMLIKLVFHKNNDGTSKRKWFLALQLTMESDETWIHVRNN